MSNLEALHREKFIEFYRHFGGLNFTPLWPFIAFVYEFCVMMVLIKNTVVYKAKTNSATGEDVCMCVTLQL